MGSEKLLKWSLPLNRLPRVLNDISFRSRYSRSLPSAFEYLPSTLIFVLNSTGSKGHLTGLPWLFLVGPLLQLFQRHLQRSPQQGVIIITFRCWVEILKPDGQLLLSFQLIQAIPFAIILLSSPMGIPLLCLWITTTPMVQAVKKRSQCLYVLYQDSLQVLKPLVLPEIILILRKLPSLTIMLLHQVILKSMDKVFQ